MGGTGGALRVSRPALFVGGDGHVTCPAAIGVSRGRVYDALRAYIEENGYPPAVRDLAAIVGLNLSTTYYHLRSLAAEGRITFGPRRSAMQVRVDLPAITHPKVRVPL